MNRGISLELKSAIFRAIEYRFSRSSGPGGQNVNKVETKVELRIDTSLIPLPHYAKSELIKLSDERGWSIGDGTTIKITDQSTRFRERNREAALKKLFDLISQSLIPKKKRKKSSIPRSQKEKRLVGKKVRKQVKEHRKKPKNWD